MEKVSANRIGSFTFESQLNTHKFKHMKKQHVFILLVAVALLCLWLGWKYGPKQIVIKEVPQKSDLYKKGTRLGYMPDSKQAEQSDVTESSEPQA